MASTDVNITSFSDEGLSQIHDIVNAAVKGIFNSRDNNSKNSNSTTIDLKDNTKELKDVASVVKALVSSTSDLKLKNVIALRSLANTIGKEKFVKSFSNFASVTQSIKPENFKGLYTLAEGIQKLSEITVSGTIRLRLGMNTYVKTVKKFVEALSDEKTINIENVKAIGTFATGLATLSEIPFKGAVRLRLGTRTYVRAITSFIDALGNIKLKGNLFDKSKGGIFEVINSVSNLLNTIANFDRKYRKNVILSTLLLRQTVANGISRFLTKLNEVYKQALKDKVLSADKNSPAILTSIADFLETLSTLSLRSRARISATTKLLKSIAISIGEFIVEISKVKISDDTLKSSKNTVDLIKYIQTNLSKVKIKSEKSLEKFVNDIPKVLVTFANEISNIKLSDAKVKATKSTVDLIKYVQTNLSKVKIKSEKSLEKFVAEVPKALVTFANEISNIKLSDAKIKVTKNVVNLINYIHKHLPALVANQLTASLVSGYLNIIAPAIVKFAAEIDNAKLPSDIKIKKVKALINLVKGLAVTMTGITLILTAVIALGGGKMIWQAFGMMALFLTMSIGIIAILGRIKMGNVAKGIIAIAGITLIIGGLVLLSSTVASLAQIEWADFGKGALMIGAAFGVVALVGALMAGIGFLLTEATAGLGAIALVAGAAAVFLVAELTKYIAKSLIDLIEKSNEITEAGQAIDTAKMWSSTWNIVQMFGSVLALTTAMAVAGLVIVGEVLVGGLGMIAFIGISWLIRKTIKDYLGLMDEVNGLDFTKIENAQKLIAGKGGLFDKMQDLAKAYSKIHVGVKDVVKSLAKTKVFNDMFGLLSKFIDIIQKMANMQYISGYKSDGTPILSPYDSTMFGEAAEKLCEGFGNFIDVVDKSFEIFDKDKSPKLLKKIAKSFNPIIETISKFVDVITTFSKGVPDGYDAEGRVKYRPWKDSEYTNAAKAVTKSFDLFLTTVENGVDTLDKKKANALKNNFGNTLLPIVKNLKIHADNVENYLTHASRVKESIKKISDGGLGLNVLSQQIADALGEYTISDTALDTTRLDNYTNKMDKVLKKYDEFSKDSVKFVKSLRDIATTQNNTKRSFAELENELKKSKINDKVKEMTKSFTELADKIQSVVEKFENYGDSVEKLRELQITDMEDRKEERAERAKASTNNRPNNQAPLSARDTTQNNSVSYVTNNQTYNQSSADGGVQYIPVPQNTQGPIIITINDGGEQVILRGEYKRP